MTFPGEQEAVERMLGDAAEFGYGNFIAHLKRDWIQMLVASGLNEDSAKLAADADPYPPQSKEVSS